MSERKLVIVLVFFAVLAGVGWGVWSKLFTPAIAFSSARLQIARAEGAVEVFNVEVAETQEQLERGLMFRRSMPRDAGMIFVMPPQVAGFWMKNTVIPLDMLFVGDDGRILKIVANTKPLDTTKISSDVPVAGVIEINAGEAARRGIAVGDRVTYERF